MDLRQTSEYGRYMQRQGWIVEKCLSTQVFVKKIPFLPFSVMKVQRYEGEMDSKRLVEIREKYGVFYTVLEPMTINTNEHQETINTNYKLSSSPYLPTKTVVIDLRKSEQKLLMEMSKDTRQRLRLKDKFLISNVRTKDEIEKFRSEWKRQHKGYVPNIRSLVNLKECFGDKVYFLTASFLAGVVILESDDTAYYYFAWTSKEGKKVNAQYQLVWEAIRMAKNKGMKFFDMEGVEDKRWPNKNWQGFSLFKKKWGGKEIELPGSWQKWF